MYWKNIDYLSKKNALENLNLTRGLVFSQEVMLRINKSQEFLEKKHIGLIQKHSLKQVFLKKIDLIDLDQKRQNH